MRAWSIRAVLCFVLAGAATAARAAPSLTIGPIEPTRETALPRQLEAALCGGACASWASVSTRGALDLKKAGALGVKGALTGAVARKGSGRVLTLGLYTGQPKAARTWSFAVGATGQLAPEAIQQLQGDLRGLGMLPPPPPPVAAVAPAAASRPPPPSPPPPGAPPAPPPTPALAAPAAQAPAAASAPKGAARPFVIAEAGLHLTGRSLTYTGASAGSATLLEFDVSAIASPRLRVEVYPLPRSMSDLVQGVGLFADYGHSVGLEIDAGGAAGTVDAAFSRLAVGALWRSPGLTSLRLVLVPSVAYQRHSLVASPTVAGLPDAELSGLSAALGVELPVASRFTLLAGLGYVTWTTAQDLVEGSPAFFPGGSASALDWEAGVAVGLGRGLSVRALLEGRSIGYSLDPDTSGAYVADGADDAYLGGRLMVRGEY